MTDKELREKLSLIQGGDKTAFEEIYNELKAPIMTIIMRITRSRELSEDILQEVFIKLYKSPPEAHISKPRAYIFRIARNSAIDGIRNQPQYVSLEDCENILSEQNEDTAEKMDVEAAMNALALDERQVVSMHINGGLKFREIAEIMAIPLGTALWKYQKAIKHLRDTLNGGVL